jgi:two-component system NtrC family sensor kinase
MRRDLAAAAGRPRWRWAAAVVLGAAGMAVRAALEPWLDGSVPFAFAFPAVATMALLAGAGPALLTIAVCAAIPLLPGIAPWFMHVHALQAGTGVFVASALLLVGVLRWLVQRGAVDPAGTAQPDAALVEQGRYVQQWLRLLIALALLLPTVFFVTTASHARRSAYDAAEERVTRGAIIVREHALKVMRLNELIFDRLRADFGSRPGAPPVADRAAQAADLARIARDLPDARSLSVWDADGALLAGSEPRGQPAAMNPGERECFAQLRAPAAAAAAASSVAAWPAGNALPCVSSPFGQTPQSDGLLVVARPREAAPGRFAGMYAVTLELDSFDSFYTELLRSEHSGAAGLLRLDGTIIAREPRPSRLGLRMPASEAAMMHLHEGTPGGLLTMPSVVDGRSRLVAYRRVGEYPLYAAVSISHEQLLRGWYREVALLAAFTFPTAFALAWVSWVALKHTRRERLALERWRSETVKRAQAEDALRQTQRLEALGHLTGGVAHDVNNLLMVVSNNAYLLKRLLGGRDAQQLDARLAKPIDAILRAVTTGSRLTRQLLAFARRQALRPEVIRLQDRLPQLLDLMRHSISSNVMLDGEAAPDADSVQVDPAELELALINLAVNARDAMPDGGRLHVEVRNAQADEHEGLGRWVSVAVSDTGRGIAPEVLEHVFEPFFTTKGQGEGTGLGLSQVYGFCQQAGGTARIRSTVGQGTTVQLLLPGVTLAPQPVEDLPPVPSAQGRLLLVEDNAEVAEATEPMLASWGYAVRGARSGDAARELIDQSSGGFELMLTDIVMPGGTDGLALARYVRARYPQVGIVLMTGHARETDKAMGEGFVVLQKPWTPQALAEALAEAHPARRAAEAS